MGRNETFFPITIFYFLKFARPGNFRELASGETLSVPNPARADGRV